METHGIREEGVNGSMNKENHSVLIPSQREKRVEQGKRVVIRASLGEGVGKKPNGSKNKWARNSKGPLHVVTKPSQIKGAKPTRGLIFGPVRGEVELSSNGKRLRVEADSLGRSGGWSMNAGLEDRGREVEMPTNHVDMTRAHEGRRENMNNTDLVLFTGPLESTSEVEMKKIGAYILPRFFLLSK